VKHLHNCADCNYLGGVSIRGRDYDLYRCTESQVFTARWGDYPEQCVEHALDVELMKDQPNHPLSLAMIQHLIDSESKVPMRSLRPKRERALAVA
jgi:hypothetical protein